MAFDAGDRDPFDDWRFAVGPWRPRPLSRRETPLPIAQRAALLVAIAVAHALLLWFAATEDGRTPDATSRETTTIVFVAPEPEPLSPSVAAEPAIAAPAATPAPVAQPVAPTPRPASPSADPTVDAPPAAAAATEAAPVAEETPPDAMVAVEPTPRPGAALDLYDEDGSLALPDDVVARLREVDADTRTFDFQMPGLMASGRFMQRQPVLAVESTRFDQYWIPDQGALTKILEKAVKATTKTVEIPIPGTRGGKLVCSVSILALGGGCGVRNNANGYVAGRDDPATLSPEEDAECRAWWDQIVAAGDQDTWRYTRALYDANCRKPLEVSPPEPE